MPTDKKKLPNINVKEMMGFVPISVWNITKDSKWIDEIRDTGEKKPKRKNTNKFLPGLKYSSFNPSVAEAIIKYWSKKGDLIVDPFSGRSTRAFVALTLNRQYVGYEISNYALNQMMDNFLIKSKGTVYNADGCKLENTNDEEADLVFTCPPYFNLEKYESVPGQLSDIKHYNEFLERIDECLSNCYRVLKNNKYCIWVVGDFRLNKSVCTFHSDTINLGIKNGFSLHDIVIEQVRSPFAWCRVRENYRLGFTAKSHQYILIFKKGAKDV